MSTTVARRLALDIAERIGRSDEVVVKRFFAGAALVTDGRQFGFVMKGSLYLHVDSVTRAAFQAMGAAPFRYPGRGRIVTVERYYEAPAEVVEDTEKLREWAARARHAAEGHRARTHVSRSKRDTQKAGLREATAPSRSPTYRGGTAT